MVIPSRLQAFVRRVRPAIGVAFLALAIGAYYRSQGVEAQFLRAESGLYLENANQGWAKFQEFATVRILGANNGHYLPIGFSLELFQAKLIGSFESIWFARQVVLLAALAYLLAVYGYRSAVKSRIPSGFFVGALALLQPIFVDLVTWPFMALQLACCICVIASAIALVSFSEDPQPRFLWWHLGLAYASTHFSGVGLAFGASAIVVATVLVVVRHKQKRSDLIVPLMLFAALVVLHGFMMTIELVKPQSIEVLNYNTLVKFGIAYWAVVTTGFESLSGSGYFKVPDVGAFPKYAVFGYLALAIAVSFPACCIIREIRLRRAQYAPFCLFGFPVIASIVCAALIASRPAGDQNSLLVGYFIGGRYIVFTFLMTLLFIGGLFRIFPFRSSALIGVFIAVLACSLVGHIVFVGRQMTEIWPSLFVSHRLVWFSVLEAARVGIRNDQPIRNITIPELGEFGFEARRYEGLIKRDLDLLESSILTWGPAEIRKGREYRTGSRGARGSALSPSTATQSVPSVPSDWHSADRLRSLVADELASGPTACHVACSAHPSIGAGSM